MDSTRLVEVRPYSELTKRGQGRRLRTLVAEVVNLHYGMADAEVRLVSMHSFNSIFQVRSAGLRFALRVGDGCRIHVEGVEDVEAEWLDSLADADITAPLNVATTTGQRWLIHVHPGVDGARVCSLFTWLDGAILRDRLQPDSMEHAGRLLARLHDHAAGFATQRPVPAGLYSNRTVYFHEENRVLTYQSPYGNLFIEAIDRVQIELDRLWAAPPHSPHLLHGDFGAHNVMTYRSMLRPIDFQDVQFGFDLQDVALTVANVHRSTPELVAPFRTGYSTVRPLPESSPKQQDLFSAARSLNIMNLALHVPDSGIGQALEDHARRVGSWMSNDR